MNWPGPSRYVNLKKISRKLYHTHLAVNLANTELICYVPQCCGLIGQYPQNVYTTRGNCFVRCLEDVDRGALTENVGILDIEVDKTVLGLF